MSFFVILKKLLQTKQKNIYTNENNQTNELFGTFLSAEAFNCNFLFEQQSCKLDFHYPWHGAAVGVWYICSCEGVHTSCSILST